MSIVMTTKRMNSSDWHQ